MNRARVLFSSVSGTALEFYDFMLYAVFADRIGQVFFPNTFLSAFQAGWLAFVLAYVSRPFGATVFGYIGDRFGRKQALVLTVSLMGIPTFLISILPGYDTIGMGAPITLLVCRLLQGLCTGGEYNGSAIFALEHMGKYYPGMSGGMITGASVIGALGATGMGILMTIEGMPSWAWRLSFLLGALISLFGLYIRRSVSESPAFEELKARHAKLDKAPLKEALLNHKRGSLVTLSIGLLNGTLSYTLYKFITLYLHTYFHLSDHSSFQYTTIGIITFIFCAPLWGLVLDKIGGRRMLKFACFFSFICAFPLFFLLQELTVFGLVAAQFMLGVCVASIAGPEHAFIQRLFPVRDRYSGVSFTFSCGMGIGAGVCPPLMKFLVESTGNFYSPALVIVTASILCWTGLHFYRGPFYKL